MDEFDDLVLDNFDFDADGTQPQSTNNTTQLDDTATAKKDPKKVDTIKFNESLLLEPKGLPLLKSESQYLVFRGRGHEEDDLKKLMLHYTVWANNCYPKLKFKDFIRRVKVPASGQRVKNLVGTWQDEFKEKRRVRQDIENELSGETVGDMDGDRREEELEESSDDENRPLFIPITESAFAAMEKARLTKTKTGKTKDGSSASASRKMYKTSGIINSEDDATADEEDTQPQKYKTSAIINPEDDVSDEEETSQPKKKKQPHTITFSDDEDEMPLFTKKPKVDAAKGREHALAVLAEKRRQKEAAKRKAIEKEEEQQHEKEAEETSESTNDVTTSKKKSLDEMLNDIDEDIQLALSDSELEALQIKPLSTATTTTTTIDNDDFSHNDVLADILDMSKPSSSSSAKTRAQIELDELNDDNIEMADIGDTLMDDDNYLLNAKETDNVAGMEDTDTTKSKNDAVVEEEDSEMQDI